MNPAPRFLPLLVLLFAGSGAAALIYEIVWFQMLQLVIGSSAVSLGVLLATFMGGMGAGSLAWPRLVSPARHPLRVYAVLEAGIALLGVAVLLILPSAGRLYAGIAGDGHAGLALRALLAAALLLPPTFLMGATLPVVARWIGSTRQGLSWLGFFYGGNTAGAVAGCLLAGFYLLRVHDLATATWCAVALNLLVAAVSLLLAARAPHPARPPAGCHLMDDIPSQAPTGKRQLSDDIPPAAAWPVFVVTALSGFCALAAEVVWTRHLALLLGGTVYTFSIILAVFLAGIGLGGAGGAWLARHTAVPRRWLGVAQGLLAPGMLWATVLIAEHLPYWTFDADLVPSPLGKLSADLIRCGASLLPPALLWGASFPLALASLAAPGRDAGRLAGGAYAANTGGAIAGSLLAGLWLVPTWGGQQTERLLLVLSVVAGMLVLGHEWRRVGSRRAKQVMIALGVLAPFAAVLLALRLPALSWSVLAYGRQLTTTPLADKTPLWFGEGLNSTVGVTKDTEGHVSFHVAGKTEASTFPKDMRLQRMLGHVPALFHPNPESILIVGCGAGVTAGTFTQYPSVKRIVICDIEPLIPQRIAPYFKDQNYDVVHDPRVEIIYDDARHYILTTQEKFDIITSDPIHPWVKGAATLYTREYFELVKQRLKPGGLVTQWVPFYESSRAVVLSELATFFEAFPEGTIWGNAERHDGYDVVLLGQEGKLSFDAKAIQQRLFSPAYVRVWESLEDVGLGSDLALFATYAGRRSELEDWLQEAVINRDRDLRLQYLAGLQLNSREGTELYNPMLALRNFPADLIKVEPPVRLVLEQLMGIEPAP
jgi:spermidine synthase